MNLRQYYRNLFGTGSIERLQWTLPTLRQDRSYLESLPETKPASAEINRPSKRKPSLIRLLNPPGRFARPNSAASYRFLTIPRREEKANPESINFPGAIHGNWLESSGALINQAQAALDTKDSQQGWFCFKAANRYLLYGMAERKPELLVARARSIHQEAKEKLTGWRQKSVLDLLADNNGKFKEDLQVDRVVQAAQTLDSHFDNIYQKLEMQRQRLVNLAIASLVLFLVWLWMSPYIIDLPERVKLVDLRPGTIVDERRFWVAIALLGCIGAVLSAYTSASKGLSNARIPDALAEGLVTTSRIAIAAITATVAVLLLISGVINLGDDYSKLILVLAIGAGFSERWVVGSLENLAKT